MQTHKILKCLSVVFHHAPHSLSVSPTLPPVILSDYWISLDTKSRSWELWFLYDAPSLLFSSSLHLLLKWMWRLRLKACMSMLQFRSQPAENTGGQHGYHLGPVRAGGPSAKHDGRAKGGSRKTEDHPGLWKGDGLVELHSAIPTGRVKGRCSWNSGGSSAVLQSGWKGRPQRWWGM